MWEIHHCICRPIAEIGEHGSIGPEILGAKNRDFWDEILRVFYWSQNWGFFDIMFVNNWFKPRIFRILIKKILVVPLFTTSDKISIVV